MLVDIRANKPLGNFYLEDLRYNRTDFSLNTDFDLTPGWYKLVIEYPGSKLKLEEIIINEQALDILLYSGWFLEQRTGFKTSPGTTLFARGQFEIWIHTDMGLMIQTIYESIQRREFGSNLFDKYMHTVDRPMDLPEDCPAIIRNWFANGNGPRWWKKNNILTPYEALDPEVLADIDKAKLLDEMTNMCDYSKDNPKFALPLKGKELKGTRRGLRSGYELPYTELDELPGSEMKRLCEKAGIKRLLGCTLQMQYPGESFVPHVDEHYDPETKAVMQGPCSFMLDLSEDSSQHYFKVGRGGLIPLDVGCFANFNYAHATFNASDIPRPLCILNGKRDNTIDYLLMN